MRFSDLCDPEDDLFAASQAGLQELIDLDRAGTVRVDDLKDLPRAIRGALDTEQPHGVCQLLHLARVWLRAGALQ